MKVNNKSNFYELDQTTASTKPKVAPPPLALISSILNNNIWHQRLGNLSSRTLNFMLKTSGLSLGFSSSISYDSCLCNKSQKLLFYESTFSSTKPLDLIFSDVWGSLKIPSTQGYHYYIDFIDHFSRFTLLFPMKKKSDVKQIFPIFKTTIEKKIGNSLLHCSQIMVVNTKFYHLFSLPIV